MSEKFDNEVQFMGIRALLNPTMSGDSSSRVYMAFSMIQQSVVPQQSDIPRILNGFEKQLSDFTFGCRAPENLQIVSLIQKYPAGIGMSSIKNNPLITVIYRSLDNGDYGVFHIESYQNQIDRVHETFTFKYKFTEKTKNLHVGMVLDKDEVLSYSPNINKDGLYSGSLNANVAYMSLPATAEDGLVVSESFMKRCQPIASGSRVAEWGKRYYPINLYGDKDNYKPFPEVGDRIRDDGLVFALRKHDPLLAGLEMTAVSLMEPDYLHDKLEYGKPGGLVYDVVVDTTTVEQRHAPSTPRGMEESAQRYSKHQSNYYDSIVSAGDKIQREERGEAIFTPMLQTLIVQAKGERPNTFMRQQAAMATGVPSRSKKYSIIKTFRAAPIDEWRVEVFYTYKFPIGLGAKCSNQHAGKGVACSVAPDADMPVDDWGNRTDIIVYEKGAISRLNPGQFYEQYINAAARDVTKDIVEMLNNNDNKSAWAHLLRYMEIVSPKTAGFMRNCECSDQGEVLHNVKEEGIYTYIPSDDPDLNLSIYERIASFRPPNKSPLTYRDLTGTMRRTIRPALIGPMAFIVLDKLDHKPMAVSGILRQHHSLPAVQNKGTKYSRPTKEQPNRCIGESESRAGAAILGGKTIADFIDTAANPAAHRAAVSSIFSADKPSYVENLVDRTKVPYSPPALSFLKHVLHCSGVAIVDDTQK